MKVVAIVVFLTTALFLAISLAAGETCDDLVHRKCTGFGIYCFRKANNSTVHVIGECDREKYKCLNPQDAEISVEQCYAPKISKPAGPCDKFKWCTYDLAPHCFEIAPKDIIVVFGDCDKKQYQCRNPSIAEIQVDNQECRAAIREAFKENEKRMH
ncbi:hypothetical protein Trydic_g5703 [Trypoxylus dichotomus]